MVDPASKPAPILQGKPASFREKLGALVAGKDLYTQGSNAFYREDFERTRMPTKLSDPLAFTRRMDRLFRYEHEKLDGLDNTDDLWNEMDYDALVSASVGHIEDAMAAVAPRINVDEEFLPYCEWVTRESAAITQDVRMRTIDSRNRGFVLGEMVIERMEKGPFRGFDTIGSIRRLERASYRLAEDNFARPTQLEIDVTNEVRDAFRHSPFQAPRRSDYIQLRTHPWRTTVLTPDDPEWNRYLFLTWPPRSNRVAGVPAFAAAWPWYYFATHLRQWMMVLGERTGTPIMVAQFEGLTNPRPGAQYPTTQEEVFAFLEEIQTAFRGLAPEGYKIEALATGAEGLAQLLTVLFETCRRMIELAIERQTVAGGGEAQGGTLGANQTIFSGTFGGLIAAQQRRQAGILAGLLEYLILLNFGRQVDVEITYEAVDPQKEVERIARIEKGINLGVINKREPWLRGVFDAEPLEDVLEETQRAIDTARAAGFDEVVALDEAGPAGSPLDMVDIIDRLVDGDMGQVAATLAIAKIMGVTREESAEIVADELARRAAMPPMPAPLPEDSAPVEPAQEPEPMPEHDTGPSGHTPPREVRRAAAIALELERSHPEHEIAQRAIMLGRAIASGKPLSGGMVERLAAWFDLHEDDSANDPYWGSNRNPSKAWLEWALHGGDAGRKWAEEIEDGPEDPGQPTETADAFQARPPDPPMSRARSEDDYAEALSIASHRIRETVAKLADKVSEGDYDTSHPPPIMRGLIRAVTPLIGNARAAYHERLVAAGKIRSGVGAALAHRLPECHDEDSRCQLVDELAEHYSDVHRLSTSIPRKYR